MNTNPLGTVVILLAFMLVPVVVLDIVSPLDAPAT